jgi:hypothetical protein
VRKQPHETSIEQAEAPRQSSGIKVYIYSVAGLLIYFGSLYVSHSWKPDEVGWISALFAIPAFAPIVGVGFHVKRGEHTKGTTRYFYDFSMKVSCWATAGYCFLWVIYSTQRVNTYREAFSILSLLGVLVFLVLIGFMMCAFLHEMDGEKWPRLAGLRAGASKEPLWALSFLFFVIFLDVAYLFGFALAFHDQDYLSRKGVPALHMINLTPADDPAIPDKRLDKTEDQPTQTNSATVNQNAIQDGSQSVFSPTQDLSFYFYFSSGQARLERIKVDESRCKLGKNEQLESSPPQRIDWMLSNELAEFNYCSLFRIKNSVLKESKDGKRARVVLVGRSDNDPIKERENGKNQNDLVHYRSNYELSDARVQNIRFEITEALKDEQNKPTWQNLEWLSLPSSDETPIEADEVLQHILEARTGLNKKQKEDFIEENKRAVRASVVSIPGEITSLQIEQLSRKSFRPMKLMDYMYFSIYTITTTGYGDIIPTTAYSKFVISLANICEVLFLVVFFNALISIKRETKNGEMATVIAYVKAQMEDQTNSVQDLDDQGDQAW